MGHKSERQEQLGRRLPALLLDSAMTPASLKFAYALISLGVAARVYVLGERGADVTWLAGSYLFATIIFSALIIGLTFKSLDLKASRAERYFSTMNEVLSYWALMPPGYSAWEALKGDPRFALVAFSLSGGVVAGFYLLIRAFRLVRPSRLGVR